MTLPAFTLAFVIGSGLCAFAQEPPKDNSTAPPADTSVPSASSPAVQPEGVVATNWHARFEEFGQKVFGLPAVIQTVPVALYDHVTNFPHEWGRGTNAAFDRVGSQYAQFFLDQSIQLALWSVHKEDSHYFREGQGNFFRRTGHALKGTVIVSNTMGGQTLAVGAIAGSYGSWAIATQWWEPRSEQNAHEILLWGSAGLIGKAASNFFHEFWPDAKRKLFTHGKTDPIATWPRVAER